MVTRLASERFSWRRWWCPADEDPPVSSGFLDDPAGPFASYFDYALVELAQLDHVRCLVLLGEAGMGKSSELEVEEQRLRAARLPVVKFDLGAEPDVPSLRDTVLTSPEVTTWLRGMCGVGMPAWCVTDRRAAAICCRVSRHRWGRLGLARLRVSALTREVPMTTTTPSTALVTIQPAFTDAERLALAGYLAGYRGLTREAYGLDLRQFSSWCRTRSPPLFAVRRAGPGSRRWPDGSGRRSLRRCAGAPTRTTRRRGGRGRYRVHRRPP